MVTSPVPEDPLEWKTKDNGQGVRYIYVDITQNMRQNHGLKRPKKEFASVTMTESSCTEYMKRVKELVSQLKECGGGVKDGDVAYTVSVGWQKD